MARVTRDAVAEAAPAGAAIAEAGLPPAAGEQAAPPATPADFWAEPALRVRTSGATRRRAGIDFGPAPRELRLADLTEEQVEQLLSDPVLMVERIAIPVADPSGS